MASWHEDAAAHTWRRVCPSIEIASIRPLGSGQDHEAFAVNEQYVLRRSRSQPDRRRPSEDAAVLELAGGRSTLPVPRVVAASDDAGVIVLELIQGIPLLRHTARPSLRLADQLAEFLGHLHGTPAAMFDRVVVDDPFPHADALDEARSASTVIEASLDRQRRSRLDVFFASTPPADSDRRCFCHNDLGAEHLLVDAADSQLVGIIDWSDAAATDPARDLARLLRDLPPETYDRVAARYPHHDPQMDSRVRFLARCYLVEDLAFGIDAGRPEYVANAIRQFDHVF